MLSMKYRGEVHKDERGKLFFNNNFDASLIKRIYLIQNLTNQVVRGWQGHKIEQRWFSVVQGSFLIKLIQIDNWEMPSKKLKIIEYKIDSSKLDVLHIPPGYVSSIKSIEDKSKLLVMADYFLGETDDEHRYELNYFNK